MRFSFGKAGFVMKTAGTDKTERFGSGGGRVVRMASRSRDVLTERDVAIVKWVYEARLATREHVQGMFFTDGGRSLCQDRLTALYRHRYLDRLPGRPVNEPAVYYVSRGARRGLELLRAWGATASIQPFRVAAVRVQHILDVTSVRAAFTQAARAMGTEFRFWLNEEQLIERTGGFGIIPDGYLQVSRATTDGLRRSAFFIEVERSAKSKASLEERFRRYADFYYGGAYERLFGTRALRLLFLVGADYNLNPVHHIALCSQLCERVGLTFARFARLDALVGAEPNHLLTGTVWTRPAKPSPVSLF